MDKLVVHGGRALRGDVKISGSKNAALPILVASLLTDEDVVLYNVPGLRDIKTMIAVLEYLGKEVEFGDDKVVIKCKELIRYEAPYDLVKQMRASALVMGPLLARHGSVKVSLPGGCAIGARPINLHLDGFKHLGASINLFEGYVELRANALVGTRIVFDYPSVGATENILMAAALAKGETIIENAAKEPEIIDLSNFLKAMGAKIDGIGTSVFKIKGVAELKGTSYNVVPDRIEAGTFMVAAALTRGELVIKNIVPEHLHSLVARLEETGIDVDIDKTDIMVKGSDKLAPVSIETLPYPGFPTDMQAQWMILMAKAKGASVITETVFENRFMHVAELKRMGADLTVRGNAVFVKGNSNLSGAQVMATDLRASAALVLAALAAEGKTEISRIYHLDRGYENIELKLENLGADVRRVK